jgi:hypothetical protein
MIKSDFNLRSKLEVAFFVIVELALKNGAGRVCVWVVVLTPVGNFPHI